MISARKYNIIVILNVLILLTAISLGGYFIYHKFIDKKEEEEVIEPVGDIEEIVEENNDLVIDLLVNENILHDDYDVTIKIPTVTSPEIPDLNDKINNDLAKYYDNDKKYNISYIYFENNDIVSLVIEIRDNVKVIDYLTYNFDINKKEIIDNHYLLNYKKIQEVDYHGILVKIYEAYLEELINKDSDSKVEIDRKNQEYLKTIDKKNCRIDIPMFLNHDNHINVIFREYRNNQENILIFNINTLKVVEEIKGL